MKITHKGLLKASPFIALAAGFAGGALAISPLARDAQAPPASGEPQLQLVQAEPLVRAAPTSRGEVQLSFAPVAARAGPVQDTRSSTARPAIVRRCSPTWPRRSSSTSKS